MKNKGFKDFFIKNIVFEFFAITTCVCLVEGICGMLLDSDKRFSYSAFFSPLIFAFCTSLISLVKYSRHKQSALEMRIRSIIHLLLVEAVIFVLVFVVSGYKNYSAALALFIAVLIVYAVVALIEYLSDKRTANEINEALKRLKKMKKE